MYLAFLVLVAGCSVGVCVRAAELHLENKAQGERLEHCINLPRDCEGDMLPAVKRFQLTQEQADQAAEECVK